jgi:hypothetical protein
MGLPIPKIRYDEADSPFQNFVNMPKSEPKTPLHRVTLNWDSPITAGVCKRSRVLHYKPIQSA